MAKINVIETLENKYFVHRHIALFQSNYFNAKIPRREGILRKILRGLELIITPQA